MALLWHMYVFIISSAIVHSAKILTLPYTLGRNSRFANIVSLSEILAERGHQVSLLTNNRCSPRRPLKVVHLLLYSCPKDIPVPAEDNDVMMTFLNGSLFNSNFSQLNSLFCEYLLQNRSLLPLLKSLQFELILVDYANICARIIVDYLNIPTIVWSNFGFGFDDDLFYPIMTSFIPNPLGSFTDRMSLWQRLRNFWDYHIYNRVILNFYMFRNVEALKKKYELNASLSIRDTYRRIRPLIFCNADFAFDYPRPLMPNVILLSGLFFKDPSPLDQDLEIFLQNSGNDGVIVVAFGSMFKWFDERRSNLLARVFAKFPQTVIWRFSAPFKLDLGNNTLIMPWLPQNDLLGHNKTKLFVTHCGISSSYEAIYHQVPIVGIPLMADQWYNCQKLVQRAEMGIQLDFADLEEKMLEKAIRTVLYNSSYKDNAARVRKLILDKPEKPRDKFIHWTEFVLRHKGVPFLFSEGIEQLSWYQYFTIDVIALSFALFIVTLSGLLRILINIYKGAHKIYSNTKKNKLS